VQVRGQQWLRVGFIRHSERRSGLRRINADAESRNREDRKRVEPGIITRGAGIGGRRRRARRLSDHLRQDIRDSPSARRGCNAMGSIYQSFSEIDEQLIF
jgi:hypothetical protein